MFVANSEKPSLKRCISLGLRSAFDLVEILLWSLEVYHCDFAERSFSGILFAHPFALRTKSIWSWSVLGKLPGTGQTGNSCGFKLTHYQISQAHTGGSTGRHRREPSSWLCLPAPPNEPTLKRHRSPLNSGKVRYAGSRKWPSRIGNLQRRTSPSPDGSLLFHNMDN